MPPFLKEFFLIPLCGQMDSPHCWSPLPWTTYNFCPCCWQVHVTAQCVLYHCEGCIQRSHQIDPPGGVQSAPNKHAQDQGTICYNELLSFVPDCQENSDTSSKYYLISLYMNTINCKGWYEFGRWLDRLELVNVVSMEYVLLTNHEIKRAWQGFQKCLNLDTFPGLGPQTSWEDTNFHWNRCSHGATRFTVNGDYPYNDVIFLSLQARCKHSWRD